MATTTVPFPFREHLTGKPLGDHTLTLLTLIAKYEAAVADGDTAAAGFAQGWAGGQMDAYATTLSLLLDVPDTAWA